MSHTNKLKESAWLSEAIKKAAYEKSVSHPYLKRCQLNARHYAWAEANRVDCCHKKVIRTGDKVEIKRAFMITSLVPGPKRMKSSNNENLREKHDKKTGVEIVENSNPYKIIESKQRNILQVSLKTTKPRENFINIMSFESPTKTDSQIKE